jgi:hypothetical protein
LNGEINHEKIWDNLIFCLVVACSSRHPIEDAKAVAKALEECSKSGDLEGIVGPALIDFVTLWQVCQRAFCM